MSYLVAGAIDRLYFPLLTLSQSQRNPLGEFLRLPGLRSYWPMSAINQNGAARDLTGSNYTLVNVGTTSYNHVNIPYVEFDGDSDYLEGYDYALFDITGTESYIDASLNGLTLGGWFRHDALPGGDDCTYISKYGDAGSRSYLLYKNSSDNVAFYVSDNGTTIDYVSISGLVAGRWHFIVGRFEPNAFTVFLDGASESDTNSFSSVYNSSASFRIGATDGSFQRYLDGRASDVFICAAAVPDTAIESLYQSSRSRYGV